MGRTRHRHGGIDRVNGGAKQELAVGLCTWSAEPITLFPKRGKQQCDELLTALACLPENTEFDCASLLEAAQGMMRSGATLILLTPGDLGPRMAQVERDGIIVLSAESEAGANRFRFRPAVQFAPAEEGDG